MGFTYLREVGIILDWVAYFNIALWILDTVAIVSVLVVYFLFTRAYQNWQVWEINSGNDVIDSTTLEMLVDSFQKSFNLSGYKIIFLDDDRAHKIFWNLKKRKKEILISKQIFISVGYELDYIVSRLWLSAKEIQKDNQIFWYKVLVKYMPIIFLLLGVLNYLGQTIVFVIGLTTIDNIENKFLDFLWVKPILALFVITFFSLLALNFYVATKVKEKVELTYNSEVLGFIKSILETYYFDFAAARQYAQQINIPFLLIFSFSHEKWLGPFTY